MEAITRNLYDKGFANLGRAPQCLSICLAPREPSFWVGVMLDCSINSLEVFGSALVSSPFGLIPEGRKHTTW